MAPTPAHEDKVRKWLHSQTKTSQLTTVVVTAQSPGYPLFYTLVFGRYKKPYDDPTENYVECRQFSIHDKQVVVEMSFCHPIDPLFDHSIRCSEAIIFAYHVSNRQCFLELPSAYEKACKAKGIVPQTAAQQPGRGTLGASLARRILSVSDSRQSEIQPPSPVMVLAVSDMDPKSTPRQVTSEEGDSFSQSIGAIFVEVSCSEYSGIANPEVKDEAVRELAKRVILKRVYAEELAGKAK